MVLHSLLLHLIIVLSGCHRYFHSTRYCSCFCLSCCFCFCSCSSCCLCSHYHHCNLSYREFWLRYFHSLCLALLSFSASSLALIASLNWSAHSICYFVQSAHLPPSLQQQLALELDSEADSAAFYSVYPSFWSWHWGETVCHSGLRKSDYHVYLGLYILQGFRQRLSFASSAVPTSRFLSCPFRFQRYSQFLSGLAKLEGSCYDLRCGLNNWLLTLFSERLWDSCSWF